MRGSVATAAAIIIGNEILSGKFADENGPFLIRRLRMLGVDLVRLVVIPDVPELIAEEVRTASARCDWVFTSGGVGPTHDDVTLESVALGLGLALQVNSSLVDLIESFGMPINDASMRMARVPEGTELLHASQTSFPVLRCRNVFVFPGVPKLFRRKFEQIAESLGGVPVLTARLFTAEFETAIAARLGAVNTAFPTVDIGSYPRFEEGEHNVIITLESRDQAALDWAVEALVAKLSLTRAVER